MPLDAQAESGAEPVFVHSTCPHDCPSVCALEVERLSETRIGRVRGARDHSYTAGVVCAKVARYAERVHHPDRLRTPLLRVSEKGLGQGRGGFDAYRPIGWDEALDRTAEALLQAEARHGAETVWPYFYAGTMGLVQRDGIERLRHAKRYSRQYSTICITLADAGYAAGAGVLRGADPREIALSDLVVIWGGNPVSTQVNLMTHVSRARKSRGAKVVVIDPYRTPTAEVADVHLALRPGTDGALAAAVIHVLLRDGHADRAYMARYTDFDAEAEAHFAARDPAWASAITGLSVDEIEAFATLYGTTKRSFLRLGYGFSRSRNGAPSMHAASCLPAVTGAWQHQGGGALYTNRALFKLDRTLIEGLDVRDPSVRLLDQSRLGPILIGDSHDLGDGPPVTALFIQNTNPVMVCPESDKVRAGFLRDDLFTCVHEQFLTETAQLADLVLPATTFLEHDDIYMGGGHSHIQVTRKVIGPYAECRSNHEVHCALAARLGAEHRAFGMSAWEIIDESLRVSGYPDAQAMHDAHWLDCALPSERMRFLDGFGHADGRFHFRADWAAQGRDVEGMPVLPDHATLYDAPDAERPFRLVTAPARSFLNSSFTETPGSRAREGRPRLKIHPTACAELGLSEGARVRVGNRRGSIVLHAEEFDGLQPDVVVIEGIWPNGAFEEGRGVNTLTSADPGKPKGGAVFHDTAVWVRPAPLAPGTAAKASDPAAADPVGA